MSQLSFYYVSQMQINKFDFIIYNINLCIIVLLLHREVSQPLSFADAAQILLICAIYEVPQRISVVCIVKEKIRRTLWWIQPIPQLPVNLIEPQQIPLFCFDSEPAGKIWRLWNCCAIRNNYPKKELSAVEYFS